MTRPAVDQHIRADQPAGPTGHQEGELLVSWRDRQVGRRCVATGTVLRLAASGGRPRADRCRVVVHPGQDDALPPSSDAAWSVAALALLRTTSPDLITAVAERIIADTDGLPLALVDMARTLTRASTLAVVARCTALDTGSDEDFEKAVQHDQEAARAFEMARTYPVWGQARRRSRRKNAARDPLHQARDIFTRLQAQPWIERTEQELAACGERRPATTTAPLARLTPREVDVVRHAAHDATNAEIAAQLYLSRRTVEYHLANGRLLQPGRRHRRLNTARSDRRAESRLRR